MGGELVYTRGYDVAKVNLMTQAEYARHRGCSRVAVGKAVKAGRISLVNELIDPVVADLQWKANSRARASATPMPDQDAAVQSPAQIPLDVPVAVDGYTASRNRREAAEAERAELSLAEEKGELIRVEAVRGALGVLFAGTRDALLQIPPRLASMLAAESVPATVQNLLHAEIHQALQQLATATERIGQAEVAPE
jgi:hypothetical protein